MACSRTSRSSSPCYRSLHWTTPIERHERKCSWPITGRASAISLAIGVLCIVGAALASMRQTSSTPTSTTTPTSLNDVQSRLYQAESSKNKPPNIVFVLADDLGHNDIGFTYQEGGYHSKIHTPRIDSLATREGTVILDQCYSMRQYYYTTVDTFLYFFSSFHFFSDISTQQVSFN
jgi:hypothetical protein